ncbi:hypothetical protein Tco_1193010 [Tanacetum coccineum]
MGEKKVYNRADVFRKIGEIDLKNSIDMAQKAKIKWAIEGGENSKFFHGIVNKKCRQQAIKGILVDAEWFDNPESVKKAFLNHFSNRFASPDSIRYKIMKNEQALMLKVDFQKAFDSVRWDYLDDILDKFGFGVKWRG